MTTSHAWAAGFFEGEGTITLASVGVGRQHRLSVEISQVDRQPLEAFYAEWAGAIYSYDGKGQQRPFHRWAVVAQAAVSFLRDIEPHVVRDEVRAKIALAITFQEGKRADWSNRSPEYKQRERDAVETMRRLNARGISPSQALDLTPLEQTVLAGRPTE